MRSVNIGWRGLVHGCLLFLSFDVNCDYLVTVHYICNMDNLIEIQFDYTYYSKHHHLSKWKTPSFIDNEELLALSYDGFYSRMLSEVPHIAKVAATPSDQLRLILVEENRPEIDLSPKYFKSQMMRLLNKGLKTITIRVVASESPLVLKGNPATSKEPAKIEVSNKANVRSKRRLDLNQNSNASNGYGNVQVLLNDNSKTIINSKNDAVPSCIDANNVMLPLERHAKKHEENIRRISDQLQSKTEELGCFDNKLNDACHQNGGHLSACGNCHLKLGHTRKSCTFSPCRSAFSCGILAKHSDQKSTRTNLTKEMSKLENELTKARPEMDSAKKALQNVNNSSKKRIEDILVNEEPHRYITSGRRNWLVLNKDVMLLQSKLNGILPTRNNVMKLLSSLVRETSQSTSTTKVSTKTTHSLVVHDTDHRMAPQKRVLETEYGIKFPGKKVRSESPDHLCLDEQTKKDFHIALKLQQKELENESSDVPPNDDKTCIIVDESSNENLQLEADAAAALLHLKSRK